MCNGALLLCDDLLFSSRITGTARALHVDLRVVRTPAELLERASSAPPRCVLLDLHNATLAIASVVPALKAHGAFVVAYGSHVDTETLRAAREAGCDVVWPRSKFVQELEQSLPVWCNAGERPA